MNVFDLYASIRLDTSGYTNSLNEASGQTASFGSKLKSGLAAAAKIGVAAIGAATTAATAFAASSVKTGMEFDSAMSQVAATMGKTMDELNSEITTVELSTGTFTGTLREFAREMGSTTAFSAQEAADALNFMALAGYDAEKSMTMLPNVLNLAAAGSIDLASASDMITDAQSALGLTMDETAQLVDKMAKASSNSNTSVAQLGEAILTVGGTAKNLAGGTTELSTALGILGDNGVKGAEGGTALRNIILSLGAPTDKAAKLMSSLGLEVYDANGNMRPLNETFGDLNAVLSTMTQGEQTQVLNAIFNKVDLKSVNALLANTSSELYGISTFLATGGVGIFTESLKETGVVAQEVAEDVAEFFAGWYEAGLDTWEIEQKLKEEFGLTQNEAYKASKAMTSAFSNAVNGSDDLRAALESSGVDWGKYSDKIWATAEGMDDVLDEIRYWIDELELKGGELQEFLNLEYGIEYDDAVLAIEAVDAALSNHGSRWDELTGYIDNATGAAQQMADTKFDNLVGDITKFQSALADAKIEISDGLSPTLREFVQFGTSALSTLSTAFKEGGLTGAMEALGTILSDGLSMVISKFPEMVSAGMQLLGALGRGILENAPVIIDTAFEVVTILSESIFSAAPQVLTAAIEIIVQLANGLSANLPTLIPVAVSAILELAETLIDNLDLLIDAAIDIIFALTDGIMDALPILLEKAPEIIAKLVIALFENKDKLENAGSQLIMDIISGIVGNLIPLTAMGAEIALRVMAGIVERFGELGSTGGNIIGALKNGLIQKADEAKRWGIDLINNFISGIQERVGFLKEVVFGVAGSIKNLIGFSEPKEGPLSNFHTYAPDMMKLFAQGIRDNAYLVQEQLDKSLNFDFGTASIGLTAKTTRTANGNASDSKRDGFSGPGNTTINIYNPEKRDAATEAREWEKTMQRMAIAYV